MMKPKEYAAVLIQLLKGVVFHDDSCWKDLLIYQKPVKDYFSQMGLELMLQESDGYAYLTQPEPEEGDAGPSLPRLTRKNPLSFEVSLLCVLLREEMDSFDAGASQASRLYLSLQDIRERLQIYFKEKSDQIRLFRELDRYVRQVESLGMIRQNNRNKPSQEPVFEVLRLIKSRVDPEFIDEFKRKLNEYAESV